MNGPGIGWTPSNREALEEFVRGARGGIAVVDFDGTCVHNDVGAARFFRAVREGVVDFSREETAALVPFEGVRGVLAGLAKSRKKSDRDLLLGGAVGVFEAILRRDGLKAAFSWASLLFAGRSQEELEEFSRRVVDDEMERALGADLVPVPGGREVWEETGYTPPEAFRAAVGIRPYRPMVDFLNRLRDEAGMRVFVVSASEETAVRVCAGAIGLKADGVVGVGLERLDGTLLPGVREPVPVGEGKIEALRLAAGSGERPAFAAGDTANDLHLLNASVGPAVFVDHGKPWTGEVLERVDAGVRLLVQEQFVADPMYYIGE